MLSLPHSLFLRTGLFPQRVDYSVDLGLNVDFRLLGLVDDLEENAHGAILGNLREWSEYSHLSKGTNSPFTAVVGPSFWCARNRSRWDCCLFPNRQSTKLP